MTDQNPIAVIAPSLFPHVDFNGLNATISTLANHTAELTPEEKVSAVAIVRDWEGHIIKRLRTKAGELQSMLRYFGVSYNGNYYGGAADINEDVEIELARVTETMEPYEAYVEALEEYEDYVRTERPESPFIDTDTTLEQQEKLNADYTAAMATFKIKVRNLEHKRNVRYTTWKRQMQADPNIKLMIKDAKKFLGSITDLEASCSEKSKLASMNIAINSPQVREALKDLLTFSI